MPKITLPTINNQLLADAFIINDNMPFTKTPVKVLFDTGAMASAIIKRVAKQLNLIPISQTRLQTPAGLSISNIYEINLILPLNKSEINFEQKIKVLEIADNTNFDIIIGMDIISLGVLIVSDNTFIFSV